MSKDSLTYLAGRFRDSVRRTEILRQELALAIRQARRDGVPQKHIAEATGYTRQQIRRIVKGAAAPEGVDAERGSD